MYLAAPVALSSICGPDGPSRRKEEEQQMHDICKPKRMITGLLAIVFAAIIVQSAAAYRMAQDQSNLVNTGAANSTFVIPYLSHGVGVNKSLYSGKATPKTPLVIPYLSHGVGVEQSLYSGTVQSPDAFDRAVTRHETFVNDMNATATAAGPDAFDRAVARHEASQSTAVRPDDRTGIHGIESTMPASQSTQSTGVRPDDRAGTRGIGTISVAQSSGSTSSTNWGTVLMAGGAVLGVLLIAAAGVALSRRQHARVLAH
jgi:hypothetical protein